MTYTNQAYLDSVCQNFSSFIKHLKLFDVKGYAHSAHYRFVFQTAPLLMQPAVVRSPAKAPMASWRLIVLQYVHGNTDKREIQQENRIYHSVSGCRTSIHTSCGVWNAASSSPQVPKCSGTRCAEVYDLLCRLLGKDFKPTFEAANPGGIAHSEADISRAKTYAGYSPDFDFTAGL